MIHVYLLLLHLICGFVCFSYISAMVGSNNKSLSPPNRDHQANITNGIGTHETKITDLNGDVLFLICEQLELKDLLNLAQASAKMSPFAEQTFRWKYGNHFIGITMSESNRRRKFGRTIDVKRIDISDFQLALDLLQYFGHLINHLHVGNKFIPNEKAAAINQAINKYCSKTLKQLDLDFIKEDTFKHLNTSFETVDELTFGVDLKRINSGIVPLNELMPNLIRLKLNLYSAIDYSFIDKEFRHLNQLQIFTTSEAWTRKTQIKIEGFFRKNPQITTIDMAAFPDEYIIKINQLLPNLHSLTIDAFDIIDTVEFEHVKHFELVVISPVPIDKLSFPRLESLKMGFFTESSDQWAAFFRRHQSVSRLFIDNAFSIPLVEFTANLPNLNDLTLQNIIMCDSFTIKDICEFIRGHAMMTKLQLLNIIYYFKEGDLENLQERLGNDWHVLQSEYNLLFERQMPIE